MSEQVIGENVLADFSDMNADLVLIVRLTEPGTISASGKSLVIAPTRGSARILHPSFGEFSIGLNVYMKAGHGAA